MSKALITAICQQRNCNDLSDLRQAIESDFVTRFQEWLYNLYKLCIKNRCNDNDHHP